MSKHTSLETDTAKVATNIFAEDDGRGDNVPAAVLATHPTQLYKVLPAQIRRRIKALKKLQVMSYRVEAEFYAEVHKLECKYNELFSGIYQTRRQFVTGDKEPTEEECDFNLDAHLESGGEEEGNSFSPFGPVDDQTKGVPYFWITIFKNVDLLNDMVQPHDEEILKHLIDIEVEFLEKDPMGFVLKFVFSPNKYFRNSTLTKYYEMRCTPDETDPFSFEGPEIIKCKGCTIDWYKNKNVTLKSVKKRQTHKAHGAVRTVVKTVKHDSFFNFFDPPQVPQDESEVDDDTESILTSDFEIGHYIREHIVPHAVLYYTGEALEEEEDVEEEEEDDDEEEITDDSDENNAVVHNPVILGKQNPSTDCKQQ